MNAMDYLAGFLIGFGGSAMVVNAWRANVGMAFFGLVTVALGLAVFAFPVVFA